MKKNWKYIIIFIILLITFFVAEFIRPKETDWSISFEKNDKIPFGTYVLYNLMNDIYGKELFFVNNRSLYEFFEQREKVQKSNLIIISNEIELSDIDIDVLLQYVADGNNVFISAMYIQNRLLDSLNLQIEYVFHNSNDTISCYFVNPNLKSENKFQFHKNVTKNYFLISDESTTTILAVNDEKEPNFVKISFGNGFFYIHNQPFVFTNYYLLTEKNYEYVFKALSYLPKTTTYWDEYFKPNRKKINSSPLRVIFDSPALRIAYFLLIIGGILYMLFIGKRKQRIIPIIKPLTNTSIEFNETIARLYLHKKNHKDIALKKYKYFLEKIRTTYFITTNEFTIKNIEKISEKTGVKIEILNKIFNHLKIIQQQQAISEQELFRFNNLIEMFWK